MLNVTKSTLLQVKVYCICRRPKIANQQSKTEITMKGFRFKKFGLFIDRDMISFGNYVLDNTMGVGTTCLGAKELNRSFIGIEKEVKYYDLAVARVFG